MSTHDDTRPEREPIDGIDDIDEPSPGVGTDGSAHSHHHHHRTDRPGVGTDGSLHSDHTAETDNDSAR